jgi:hypothetical protein
MKNLLCPFAILFLVFTGISAAQIPLEIGGNIETCVNLDLDESDTLRSRTTFKLNLNSYVGDKVHGYVSLKMYTDRIPQFDWRMNEAYIDYYTSKFDLRTGVQIISWGTAYRLNPSDNINPFDLTALETFIPEEKLGIAALRLKYYPTTNLILTGIFIPYFIPTLEMPGVVLPERKLENSEYAFKVTTQSFIGCDLSASYFRGKEDYPWINGQYRNVEIFGGDIIGTIWEMAFWAEGAYTKSDTGDSYYQIAGGGEYTFGNDLYCMGQLYHINYPDVNENYLMAVLRYPFMDIHTLQLGMAYEIENEILIGFPEITLSLADAASFVISGIFVNGDVTGTLMSGLKHGIILKLEYSF